MSLPGGSAVAAATMSVQMAETSLQKDFDLLYPVLELMSSISSGKETSDELQRKVVAFRTKLSQCKDMLNKIPGLEYSVQQQEHIYQKCFSDLQTKRLAVENLKSLSIIQNNNGDVSASSLPPPVVTNEGAAET